MKANQDDQALIDGAKKVLDQANGDLDEGTRQRLRVIRREALAQPSRRFARWEVLGGLTATMAMGVVVAILWASPNDQRSRTAPMLADLEMLGGSESLEMYEDLDFYQWLENEATTG